MMIIPSINDDFGVAASVHRSKAMWLCLPTASSQQCIVVQVLIASKIVDTLDPTHSSAHRENICLLV